MSQALLPFRVEVIPTNDKVTGRAGLPLIVELLAAFGMTEVIHRELKIRQRSSGYREGELLEDMAMLMAAGGDCVADIKILKADGGLCRMLDRKLPSEDALFDFLYAFHSEDLIQQAKPERVNDSETAPSTI